MRSLPRITIVTVALNDRQGLITTLTSCERQTYEDIEHIIVDGGSIDDSVNVLQKYRPRYLSTWTSEPDEGIYDAMNRGAKKATGDMLLFLNSGDALHASDTLDFVAQDWSRNDWEWGYGAMRYVDIDGQPVGAATQYPFNQTLLRLGRKFVPHQAMFISTALFKELGGYKLKYPLNSEQELAIRAANISVPAVWVEFLCDFLAGGAHASLTPFARELSYHHMRRDLGMLLLSSRIADIVYTTCVASFMTVRTCVARVVKSRISQAREAEGSTAGTTSWAADA
ncbi:MAG: glycosyltransferase [Alcaligenaceae bacterium]|nr:MAG: glycosyltransferase [Alcaligenaceae bacterium]